jgi:hypothetical protein
MAYMPALSYEAIADGLTVCTSSLHRFGTDAVLLTEFSGYRQKDRVCDFGTGCGIIPMLMQRQAPNTCRSRQKIRAANEPHGYNTPDMMCSFGCGRGTGPAWLSADLTYRPKDASQ